MVPEMTARLVAGAQQWMLGENPQTVPATQLVVAVVGAKTRTVIFDGQRVRLSPGVEGLYPVDLTRSTGYHRLQVDDRTYWFATEDSKLKLEGIEAMLASLRGIGTGWTGQVLFSNGVGLRDVHVVYGWLDQHADAALAAISAILATPRSTTTNSTALSRRGGSGVLRAPTLRLLRSAPRENLAPNPEGVLQIGDERYDPLRVVVRKRRSTLDTIANRRAVSLLTWVIRLTDEVIGADAAPLVAARCRLWRNAARTLALRPLAQSLRPQPAEPVFPRQREEATESAYRTTYALSTDVRHLFGWSASKSLLHRYSYVEQSDSIYQAYVATRIAAQLGLQQQSPVLGAGAIAFSGKDFDLYYDTKCPPSVLRSWRASSSKPDESRPDLLLHERSTGRVALLDAKYRTTADRTATEDSRKEVTSYLGLYGLSAVGIVFPGRGEIHSVIGKGRSIHEIPLTPANLDLNEAVDVIIQSLETPPY